ncbi:MAG: hypothetical protein D6803_02360 [Anaerolineae bacterium]|nr:MAG: hypothetical protein D6803_02360 [Anaerolineae bacterium]
MRPLLKKHIALPQEHGSWVFLFSPLLIGLFAGEHWHTVSLYLALAALFAFLLRQPLTVLVKVRSGRRPRRDLPAARFWALVYAGLSALMVLVLVVRGYAYVLWLALPGVPVFAWHLSLVSRRAERRQMGVEIVAAGVLALIASGAYWVGRGEPHPLGWLLWLLTWLQAAASIVYAYLRLEQRVWEEVPPLATRFRRAGRALAYAFFDLAFVGILAAWGVISPGVVLPFGLQAAETLWGAAVPAVGMRPTRIGVRQLLVSTLFTLLFILGW